MIIPIRCMNCGNMVSSLYRRYQAEIEKLKKENPKIESDKYVLDTKEIPVTAEKIVLDKLGLRRICCRNHMLTHIDLLHKV
jgi:DNA-directed RNA polymerase subunit N (RpoN/RPB10)